MKTYEIEFYSEGKYYIEANSQEEAERIFVNLSDEELQVHSTLTGYAIGEVEE